MLENLRPVVDREDDGHTEFVLVWPEGAEVVAQFLGQHRQNPIDQIDTCTAFVCLVVGFRAGLDIIGNIGNMDAYLHRAVVQTHKTQGIVKILGIGRVDGECENLAHIATANYLVGIYHGLSVINVNGRIFAFARIDRVFEAIAR